MRKPVIVAGGGIGGLTTALTLHEIGVPVRVFESAMTIRPFGVGINLQPNAVRELTDLGLADRLPDIGVEAEEWALVGRAKQIWEYPMVDRDPAPTWVDSRVALLGDAAHVMYPVGSNGASQAIVDARVLGASLVEHGLTPDALATYQDRLHEDVSALVLRNREAGPVAILGTVDERCGGVFDDINDVIPRAEVESFMARYKAAAGFAVETLNAAPRTLPEGATLTPRS